MNIPAKTLSTLAPICDVESSRYALGGVRLERQGDTAHAVVTDGRRLVAVEWNDSDTPAAERVEAYSTTIPAAACRAIDKAAGAPSKRFPMLGRVAVDEPSTNGSITATTFGKDGQSTLTVQTLEGRYPMWRDVIPERSFDLSLSKPASKLHGGAKITATRGDYVCITLDPTYVAEVCTALAKIGTTDTARGVEFFIPIDGDSAVVIKAAAEDRPKVVGVIMPLSRGK
jgi:DNA polymerase-3 subunit beta